MKESTTAQSLILLTSSAWCKPLLAWNQATQCKAKVRSQRHEYIFIAFQHGVTHRQSACVFLAQTTDRVHFFRLPHVRHSIQRVWQVCFLLVPRLTPCANNTALRQKRHSSAGPSVVCMQPFQRKTGACSKQHMHSLFTWFSVKSVCFGVKVATFCANFVFEASWICLTTARRSSCLTCGCSSLITWCKFDSTKGASCLRRVVQQQLTGMPHFSRGPAATKMELGYIFISSLVAAQCCPMNVTAYLLLHFTTFVSDGILDIQAGMSGLATLKCTSTNAGLLRHCICSGIDCVWAWWWWRKVDRTAMAMVQCSHLRNEAALTALACLNCTCLPAGCATPLVRSKVLRSNAVVGESLPGSFQYSVDRHQFLLYISAKLQLEVYTLSGERVATTLLLLLSLLLLLLLLLLLYYNHYY